MLSNPRQDRAAERRRTSPAEWMLAAASTLLPYLFAAGLFAVFG